MEKTQVSKVVKRYILSIDSEAQEYFEKTISLIEKQIREDVLGTPLISSNDHIRTIVEKEMKDFIHTIISLIDYYVEGIYDSGKNVSRKKLKLNKEQPKNGEKYSFTLKDKYFIENYKANKLTDLNSDLEKAVVDYVTELIFDKINNKWRLNDEAQFAYIKQELVDDEMSDIINIVTTTIRSVFDEVMDIVSREIILLFRRAQIEEYRNLGINVVTFITEDEELCCPVCAAKSGKIFKIDNVIDEYGIKGGTNHSLCKYSIDPVINYQDQLTEINVFSEMSTSPEFTPFVDNNSMFIDSNIKTRIDFEIDKFKFKNVPIEIEYRINKLIKKFQIYAKQFIRDIEFIFVDNITDNDDWFKSVKEHYISKGENEFDATNKALKAQDDLKFKIASFDYDNKYYISVNSFDSQLIEDIIVRKIIKDHIQVDNWIKNKFEERKQSKHIGYGLVIYEKPFISYLAQESAGDYLLESAIAYVNQPKKLKAIDNEIFEYIKENIFKGIQFF